MSNIYIWTYICRQEHNFHSDLNNRRNLISATRILEKDLYGHLQFFLRKGLVKWPYKLWLNCTLQGKGSSCLGRKTGRAISCCTECRRVTKRCHRKCLIAQKLQVLYPVDKQLAMHIFHESSDLISEKRGFIFLRVWKMEDGKLFCFAFCCGLWSLW